MGRSEFNAPERPRAAAQCRGRVRVRRDHYLRAHQGSVLTVGALATGLGISAGRLRDAIRVMLGMSASRFLSLRRLFALRAAASRCGPDATCRKALAHAHGYWNVPAVERQY